MLAIYLRLIGLGLRMAAVLMLFALGLVAVRFASELGRWLGGAIFQALATYQPMASGTREIFEGSAAVFALVASSLAFGWLWYRLVLLRRRIKIRSARPRRPAPAIQI